MAPAMLVLFAAGLLCSACSGPVNAQAPLTLANRPEGVGLLVTAPPLSPAAGRSTAGVNGEYNSQHIQPPTLAIIPTDLPPNHSRPLATPSWQYTTQPGDTRAAIAARFGVPPAALRASPPLPQQGLLDPGQVISLPPQSEPPAAPVYLLPDGAVVYGPATAGFDIGAFLQAAGGYLGDHQEYLPSGNPEDSEAPVPAATIIQHVALEYSIDPRLLLALLEYHCGCVSGPYPPDMQPVAPLGLPNLPYQGLYGQLSWASGALAQGYYGWREGSKNAIELPGGIIAHPSPALNAGSLALYTYFAEWRHFQAGGFSRLDWESDLDLQSGFPALYQRMFGDPWADPASTALLPGGLSQPRLQLPFEIGSVWSFSSGPHRVWNLIDVPAALDFAPASRQSGCGPSAAWVTAVAPGLIVRSQNGLLVQDLDGDGYEGTGWVMLYLHIAGEERLPAGVQVQAGQRMGHPSCEGGYATGVHLHLARKFNGEWIAAAGPLPFILDGWTAADDEQRLYGGSLSRDGRIITARPSGTVETLISRDAPTGDDRLSPADND